MKIDFSQEILTLDGEPMKTEKGETFTLRNAAVICLDAMTEEIKQLSPKDKYHRGHLAERIYRAKEPIKVDVTDVALVKELIGKIYGPHIVKVAWDLLDADGEEEPVEMPKAVPEGQE